MNEQLIKNNYLVVPNFISSQRSKELAQNYKEYVDTHELEEDPQVPGCFSSKMDYIPFLELLVEKSMTVTQLVGETVLPTYSYARIYGHGAELKDHTDKPECEISLTVNLDCDEVWDIHIAKPSGEMESVSLQPGDAMIYLGCSAIHGRDPFVGNYCTQVFLHYVRSNGVHFASYFNKDHRYKHDPVKVKTKPKVLTVSHNRLAEYIKVYDDVLTPADCETIMQEYKDSNLWKPAAVSAGNVEDRTIRNCDTIGVSMPDVLTTETRRTIDKIFFRACCDVAKRYMVDFPHCTVKEDTGYDLLRYKTGGFYSEHCDSFKEMMRSVSIVFALNDDYKGGNLAFFDREVEIALPSGSAIAFPSNFMYPHQVLPVLDGTRYSMVTWLK
tara:strand:- start:300 stop:1451 length:1152 start_codon:yes stop_codon:yes gene_type:complete